MGKLVPYNKKGDNNIINKMINEFFEKPDIFINKLFNGFFSNNFLEDLNKNILDTQVKETENQYIIELDLQGYKKEQIDIQINKRQLIVKANRRDDYQRENDGFITRQSKIGHFERSFGLQNVKRRMIKAVFENGILKITMPKIRKG